MRGEQDERDERWTTDTDMGGDAQPHEQEDDLTFEVTDLASGASHAHPLSSAPTTNGAGAQRRNQEARFIHISRRPRQVILTLDARALRIGLAALALVVVVGIVLESLPHLRPGALSFAPPATQTPEVVSQVNITIDTPAAISQPSVFPTATIPLQPLGSIPPNCSPDKTVPSLGAPGLGTAVGHDPVWVDAFDGAAATLSIPTHGGNQFTQYGWQVTIELVFTNNFNAPVTLIGNSLTTNYPLWFGSYFPDDTPNGPGQAPTTSFTIDSQQAQAEGAGVSGNTVFYPISLYLPGADCYHLSANWPGGGWQIAFAAGA